uniref:Uncharacterized protein n=1 Tax=Rhizophora mucronata TaxID=61149 RepID=A0A2P2QDU0_RHIMU
MICHIRATYFRALIRDACPIYDRRSRCGEAQ